MFGRVARRLWFLGVLFACAAVSLQAADPLNRIPQPEEPMNTTATLKAGWSQADITPEEPVILTGQFHARMSEGVKDPLTATALALESARGEGAPARVVMVSLDLLSASECIRDAVRKHLRADLPELAPTDIVFNATHTHTAPYHYTRPRYQPDAPPTENPYGIDLPVMSGADYVAFASRRIADAVIEAWRSRQTTGVAYGLGHAVAGRNRLTAYTSGKSRMYGKADRPDFSHVEGYEDHSVHVMAFYRPNMELSGLIVNLACTAQVEGQGWRVSADYWHEGRIELRRRFGEGVFVLPQISSAGDQDSRPPVEFAAEERMQRLAGRTRRQELAARIADAVERTLELIETQVEWDPLFEHRAETVELPRRRLSEDDVSAALKESDQHRPRYEELLAEIRQNPAKREEPRWYRDLSRAYRLTKRGESVRRRFQAQQRNPNLPVELHAVRIGDVGIVTNPFELYLDYGIRIKGRSPAIQTFVVQLAGPGSYVPTRRSIAGGAYGAVPASTEIGPEGGEALVEWSLGTLQALWAEEQK